MGIDFIILWSRDDESLLEASQFNFEDGSFFWLMTDDDERILNLNIDLITGFGALKEVTTDRDPGFGEELE